MMMTTGVSRRDGIGHDGCRTDRPTFGRSTRGAGARRALHPRHTARLFGSAARLIARAAATRQTSDDADSGRSRAEIAVPGGPDTAIAPAWPAGDGLARNVYATRRYLPPEAGRA
jgi:hypothetical protein